MRKMFILNDYGKRQLLSILIFQLKNTLFYTGYWFDKINEHVNKNEWFDSNDFFIIEARDNILNDDIQVAPPPEWFDTVEVKNDKI